MKKYSPALLAMATALAISTSAFATSIGLAGSTINIGDSLNSYSLVGATETYGLLGSDVTSTNTLFFASYTPATATATIDLVSNTLSATTGESVGDFGAHTGGIELFTVTGSGLDTIDLYLSTVIGRTFISGSDGTGYAYDATTGAYQKITWGIGPSSNGTGHKGYSFEATLGDLYIPPPVPEPSSLLLLGTGMLGLAFFVFRKAKPAGFTASM